MHVVTVPETWWGSNNIWRNKWATSPRSDDFYTSIDPRRSVNCSHKKHVENHIRLELCKASDKEKVLKAARGKRSSTYRGTQIKKGEKVSSKTMQTRWQWRNILKGLSIDTENAFHKWRQHEDVFKYKEDERFHH